MNRKKIVILLASAFLLLLTTPVFASETNDKEVEKSNSQVTLLQNIKQQLVSKVSPRGTVISTGILQISNPGNGEITVYMQTLAHKQVDKTEFSVSLDRWLESDKRWSNVASYTFSYSKEDYPEEDLSDKSVSFNIIGQPDNCYYRLRGIHIVQLGDKVETLSSETDGLLITKD